jgi:hypothetical protein
MKKDHSSISAIKFKGYNIEFGGRYFICGNRSTETGKIYFKLKRRVQNTS